MSVHSHSLWWCVWSSPLVVSLFAHYYQSLIVFVLKKRDSCMKGTCLFLDRNQCIIPEPVELSSRFGSGFFYVLILSFLRDSIHLCSHSLGIKNVSQIMCFLFLCKIMRRRFNREFQFRCQVSSPTSPTSPTSHLILLFLILCVSVRGRI